MSAHTPGPWRAGMGASSHQITGPGGEADYIATVYDVRSRAVVGSLPDVSRANARLIAAAPDLLAACEAIEWQYDPESDTSFCPCCKMSKERGHRGDCELSAAIRKARGEA